MANIETTGDFSQQREEWAKGKAQPVITSRDQADRIALPGQDIAVLLGGEETAGQMSIFEIIAEPGAGAPSHHQTRENEYWYIVEGEWEVQVGEETRTVGPGSMILVPAMANHVFRVVGDQPGKMLTINAPSGHELFFSEMAKFLANPTPEMDPAELIEKAARFDTVFKPPA